MISKPTDIQDLVLSFLQGREERRKWSAIEDKAEEKLNKAIQSIVDKKMEHGDPDHVLTAQEWDSPRPEWEFRTWNKSPTSPKVVFICSCGEGLGSVSRSGSLTKVNDTLERHFRSTVKKQLGVAP